ncbi:MAG: phosphoribosylformylglycinamidine cyclo-ligase [Candidatus Omnitrophica bacterium]|nr:phosphoribosylformylglycinamidine cyclo-ligase [Candidatus Omnitrophota bacterium]
MTYKTSGVDIDRGNLLVDKIKKFVDSTKTKGVISSLGGFSGLFKADFSSYKEPVLVGSTDGVGTKLKIAFLVNKHDTVGIDLVAMSVNDILALGAKPLFFLDYIATGRINPKTLSEVVKGISRGCKEAGCALIGGETAEMPSFYKKGEYDLAGFCIGMVERRKIIDSSQVEIGDRLIGIQSSGLHSNGFSLVRKIFNEKEIKKDLWRVLLKPTIIYTKPISELLKRVDVKGIAHITGGAFYDKLPRIIHGKKSIRIYKGTWEIPGIFKKIQKRANISDKEMYRTFNMGIGVVLAIPCRDLILAKKVISGFGLKCWVIGEIVKGEKEVVFI